MCDICDDLDNQAVIDEVKAKVTKLCADHPVYK
jgi:glycine hydroxymethyltransferase